jgi:hypothetical protein
MLFIGGIVGFAQERRISLLIVDETETFDSSIRVQVLASLLKKTGLFKVSAKIAKVNSSFINPLQGIPDRRYDIILIVPKGVDDGSIKQIWIITRPINCKTLYLMRYIELISEIVEKIFLVEAVDITEDLIPAYFAVIFIQEGWL